MEHNNNRHHSTSNQTLLANHTNIDRNTSSIFTPSTLPTSSAAQTVKYDEGTYSSTYCLSSASNSRPVNNARTLCQSIQDESSFIATANRAQFLNDLSILPMTNTGSHLMSTLNPAHLSDNTGPYFVSGLTDLTSNYKLNPSSNTDIPSPSSSSNSSNPPSSSHHHHHHQQGRRYGEGGDPSRKRQMRLQKNREAARECRRKKKEYIKCLEERVAGLEAQNKALIEELRQLKELYCQREDTNNKSNSKPSTSTR